MDRRPAGEPPTIRRHGARASSVASVPRRARAARTGRVIGTSWQLTPVALDVDGMAAVGRGDTHAAGLANARTKLGVSRLDVLAVGDGHNDMDTLAWAGVGVAIGKAPDDVRGGADVACKSVDADGREVLLDEYVE
ncbi:MAG: HAD hydrolase family protein [Jiangellaceae bacterium]|nr:HAD hydrolase family protein [Jiangellaceae bacterium]